MALTFRSNQSDALSINELDNNFRHFTGSHEISGSITLTEGGNSSTLSSTDIAAFKEGKFAVGSSKSRGGSTNYAILNSVFNEADSNTKMDLATSGVISFVANSLEVLDIDSTTKIITIGDESTSKPSSRFRTVVAGHLFVKGLAKFGSSSVAIDGEQNLIKASILSAAGNDDGIDPGDPIENNPSSLLIDSTRIILRSDNEHGDITGAGGLTFNQEHSIDFQTEETTRLKIGTTGGFISTSLPLKFENSILTSDTADTLNVLVIGSDGIVKQGAVVSSLGGGDSSGESNQNAIGGIRFGLDGDQSAQLAPPDVGIANAVATSATSSLLIHGGDIIRLQGVASEDAGASTLLTNNTVVSQIRITTGSGFRSVPSSSFAATASYVLNAVSASYVLNAVSSSYASNAAVTLQQATDNGNISTNGIIIDSNADGLQLGDGGGTRGKVFQNSSQDLFIQGGGAGTNNVVITSNNNIGLGVVSPTSTIHLGSAPRIDSLPTTSSTSIAVFHAIDGTSAKIGLNDTFIPDISGAIDLATGSLLNAYTFFSSSTQFESEISGAIDAATGSLLGAFTFVSSSTQIASDVTGAINAAISTGSLISNITSTVQGTVTGSQADGTFVFASLGLKTTDNVTFNDVTITRALAVNNITASSLPTLGSERTPLVIDSSGRIFKGDDYAAAASSGSFVLKLTGSNAGGEQVKFNISEGQPLELDFKSPLSASLGAGTNVLEIDLIDSEISGAIDAATGSLLGAFTFVSSSNQIAGNISGAIDAATSSLLSAYTFLSSSNQIAGNVSGAIVAATQSLLNAFTFLSSSAQIAADISGAFNSVSGTLSSQVDLLETSASAGIVFVNGEGDAASVPLNRSASFVVGNAQGTVFDLEVTSLAAGAGAQVTLTAPSNLLSSSLQIASEVSGAINLATGSLQTQINNVTSVTGSVLTFTGSIQAQVDSLMVGTGSINNVLEALNTYTGSINTSSLLTSMSSAAQGAVTGVFANNTETKVDIPNLGTGGTPTFAGVEFTGASVKATGLDNSAVVTPLVVDSTGKIMTGSSYATLAQLTDAQVEAGSGITNFTVSDGTTNTSITLAGTVVSITGSSPGIDTTLTDTEYVLTLIDILSGSAQIATDISGAFDSASNSANVTITSISTSFADTTTELATDITALITDVSGAIDADVAALSSSVSVTNTEQSNDIIELQTSASAGIYLKQDGLDLGFSVLPLNTASFAAGGGAGLGVNVANDKITYTLQNVLSSSAQIATDISGAIDAATGSSITTILNSNGLLSSSVQIATDITGAINSLTGSIIGSNAFATASIFNGGSILAASSLAALTFEAGNNITLVTSSGRVLISATTSSGGGGGSDDGYIGDAQDHTAGGNLAFNAFSITSIADITSKGNITLGGNPSNGKGKVIFGDTNNTYISANSINDNPVEDLEIHADQDILLLADNFVGIGTSTPSNKLDVSGDIRSTNDVIADADVCVGDKVHHIGDPGTHVAFGSDTINIKTNNFSMGEFSTEQIVFNRGNVANMTNGIRFSTTINSHSLFINSNDGSSHNGNVGIHTSDPQRGLDVNVDARFRTGSGNIDVRMVNLPTSPSGAMVVTVDSAGRLYRTSSEALGGGSGGSSNSEVISSNTVANYNNTLTTATFPALTDPDGGSLALSSSYTYLRAEFFARSGSGASTMVQAARSVFVWDSGSGDALIASTVEDIRTDETVTLFDMNSVTGSWNSSGDLVVSVTQYTSQEVDYKLRYITI